MIPDSPNYSDHLTAALRCLDAQGIEKLARELAARVPDKLGAKGLCVTHHQWDRFTIDQMRCIYCRTICTSGIYQLSIQIPDTRWLRLVPTTKFVRLNDSADGYNLAPNGRSL